MTRQVLEIPPLDLPYDVRLNLPGSKSQANRLLVLAALLPGKRLLAGLPRSEDVTLMIEGLRTLGYALQDVPGHLDRLHVEGGPPPSSGEGVIDCGLAGTTSRFLTAVAAVTPGRWTLTGTKRLAERPIAPLLHGLRALGARIESDHDRLPLRIDGGPLAGNTVKLDTSESSQFLSALLLIAPVLGERFRVETFGEIPSRPYVDLTKSALDRLGWTLQEDRGRFAVRPVKEKRRRVLVIDTDWSAAGAWFVLDALTCSRFSDSQLWKGGREQGDRRIPWTLRSMTGSDPLSICVDGFPDQLMNLAVFAAHRHGRTRFVGASNLREKECDRLAVLVREFRKAGIRAEETADGVLIEGPNRLCPAELDPEGDHRMAMAFGILAMLHEGIRILDPQCVDKSYPGFFDDLAAARKSPRCVALIGMRAVGKTTLAGALAQRLGAAFRDTDGLVEGLFARRIPDIVRDEGWDAFRRAEEDAVTLALEPGTVAAVGGGAVESPLVRRRLQDRAVVVWVREEPEVVAERVRADGGRPSLTGEDPASEIRTIMAAREPLYQSLADIELPPGLSLDERVEACLSNLENLCSW